MTHVRLALVAAFLCGVPLFAQSPAAGWQTIETAHFRVHFPREYTAWAERAASRLESVREAVTKEVGFSPETKIDVVVMNPSARPNGLAYPILDGPRIVLYTEAPGPEEEIGAYGHWIDLLTVHETAHIIHMLRPSRNPLTRALEKSVLPFNPITLRGPRWVLEGYATVIEGRLTGAGRPTSTMRAMILRKWAQNGRLPTYTQLNSDRRFLGMSMAYLMGSAYLEWLEERTGPGSLQRLWARMTARQRRSFDVAFEGVFGDNPQDLYGRFVAELTASAMEIDRAGGLREGELWQETTRGSGDPAVSPDGRMLAAVLRPRERPQRLVIWSTERDEEAEKKDRERIEKMLQRDPEDVAPVRVKPLPRKELYALTLPDGGDIESPRWMRHGTALLYTHRTSDRDGFLHHDLFAWTPATATIRRITELADVKDADPFPRGDRAVAVRSRFGTTQLVTVDLTTGVVTPLNEPSIDVVYTNPRVSPDGTRIAYVAHRAGRWTLNLHEVATNMSTNVPLPEGADASGANWLTEQSLVATLSRNGYAEVHRIPVQGPAVALTRTSGGALQPTASSDGQVYFMSLEPDGFVIRKIGTDVAELPPPMQFDRPLVPALPGTPAEVQPFVAQPLDAPRDYGIGRQEFAWFAGQNFSPEQRALELGVRFGDVVGRLDTLVIGSYGRSDAPTGAAISTAWRGWPVDVSAHAFTAEEREVDRSGVELRGTWATRSPLRRLLFEAGGLAGDDELLFGAATFTTRQLRDRWRYEQSVHLEADVDENDLHARGVLALAVAHGSFRLSGRYQREEGDGLTVGGLASSILPRSAYARRILDPALPLASLAGDRYDGWRIDTNIPGIPLTFFYQRHEIGRARLRLAGVEHATRIDPSPILRTPGFDLTLGAARIFDGALRDETKYWLGVRWRP